MTVYFIDTSVFCNILPIPGRDQDVDSVRSELELRQKKSTLILPVTTIIESGNFIAQVSDGGLRRRTAEKFSAVLRMVVSGQAPWSLHQFAWDRAMLEDLIDGCGTGADHVQHAVGQVGAGDLTILAERSEYVRRAGLTDVQIWTLDHQLHAYGSVCI